MLVGVVSGVGDSDTGFVRLGQGDSSGGGF